MKFQNLFLSEFQVLLLSGIILIILDAIFIGFNATYFKEQVASVQRVALQVNYLGLVLCYFLLIAGLYYFVLRTHESPMYAFLLGLFVYGVFETTNLGLFKKWSLQTVLMDTVWGGVLFGTTTYLVYKILK